MHYQVPPVAETKIVRCTRGSMYQISEFYSPDHARGVRWDDPAFQIPWPPDNRTISQSDRTYPDFRARQSRQDAGDPGRAPQEESR